MYSHSPINTEKYKDGGRPRWNDNEQLENNKFLKKSGIVIETFGWGFIM